MHDISSNSPTKTIFYNIEETIKSYRRLSQKKISAIVPKITMDQALILLIADNDTYSQTEISAILFKDGASMTRIIDLMIKKNYLTKIINESDRRKVKLSISIKGKSIIRKLSPVVQKNRDLALTNVSKQELNQLFATLKKITNNCHNI